MFRFVFQLIILISFGWIANGFSEFFKGLSINFQKPPFTVYSVRSTEAVTLGYIEQRVDNFDSMNNATFKMKFYRNDEFFKSGSPIIIFVGGEWAIYPEMLVNGRIYELAKDFDAQLFYTEHRYYGESRPTPDTSTENLKYLSVDQALADLAQFIVEIKKEPGKENSPVVLVGGSYSATMVTWFQQKYPNLAVGAWASSAPLFAKVDFVEYKEIVGAAIREVGGEKCYQLVKSAIDQSEAMINDNRIEEFNSVYKFCDIFDGSNILDIWLAFYGFSFYWGEIVQYHNNSINIQCELLEYYAKEPNVTEPQAYGLWFRTFFAEFDCLHLNYESALDLFKNSEWNSNLVTIGYRQWMYQTCSELGWYQTSGSRFQPFGSLVPVDFNYQYCEDLFGLNREAVDKAIQRTNEKYGGFNPNVENVFFTHGQLDPWRVMGVQTTQVASSPAIVIHGASHCQDLDAMQLSDNPEMRAAKLKIKHLIEEWIKK